MKWTGQVSVNLDMVHMCLKFLMMPSARESVDSAAKVHLFWAKHTATVRCVVLYIITAEDALSSLVLGDSPPLLLHSYVLNSHLHTNNFVRTTHHPLHYTLSTCKSVRAAYL